jgi:HTH-type transcriptional regulator/antitoxin HigA
MPISNIELRQITEVWPRVSNTIHAPHSDKEYGELREALDQLMDKVGDDETHPLASLMDVLRVLVQKYEDEHVPVLPA